MVLHPSCGGDVPRPVRLVRFGVTCADHRPGSARYGHRRVAAAAAAVAAASADVAGAVAAAAVAAAAFVTTVKAHRRKSGSNVRGATMRSALRRHAVVCVCVSAVSRRTAAISSGTTVPSDGRTDGSRQTGKRRTRGQIARSPSAVPRMWVGDACYAKNDGNEIFLKQPI